MKTLREDLQAILRRSPCVQTYYLKNVLRQRPVDGATHDWRPEIRTNFILAELRKMERDGVVKNMSHNRETIWMLTGS